MVTLSLFFFPLNIKFIQKSWANVLPRSITSSKRTGRSNFCFPLKFYLDYCWRSNPTRMGKLPVYEITTRNKALLCVMPPGLSVQDFVQFFRFWATVQSDMFLSFCNFLYVAKTEEEEFIYFFFCESVIDSRLMADCCCCCCRGGAGLRRHWPCCGWSLKSANWGKWERREPENPLGCCVRAGHVARTLSLPLATSCLLSRSPSRRRRDAISPPARPQTSAAERVVVVGGGR